MNPFFVRLYMVCRFCYSFFVAFFLLANPIANAQPDPVDDLRSWLKSDLRPPIDDQAWADKPLTKPQAEIARHLLWQDYVQRIERDRRQEWKSKVLSLDDLQMKFEFKTFGKPGQDGRRLFISMHGGGGAPAKVNDQQWRNQVGLYQPEEGIYLAPRAPTDTWNLWHQGHIDKFFERLIQDAVVFEGVDPNRVYILGYSAGGDGVYQLAPRMADRLAAAAMMAGHPNDASPLGLRNIAFTLHMGGDDAAYNRNGVARDWEKKLARLRQADSDGYIHKVVIHEGKGHWMDRQDAVAIPWMEKFIRDPTPARIVWKQSSVVHREFYWLAVDDKNAFGGAEVIASLENQTIDIETTGKIASLYVRLNDSMVDLDQPVSIRVNGQSAVELNPGRSIRTLHKTLNERGDINLMFPTEYRVAISK